MYCKKCHYCLYNLGEAVLCPECGGRFDKGDAESYFESLGPPVDYLKNTKITSFVIIFIGVCFILSSTLFVDLNLYGEGMAGMTGLVLGVPIAGLGLVILLICKLRAWAKYGVGTKPKERDKKPGVFLLLVAILITIIGCVALMG